MIIYTVLFARFRRTRTNNWKKVRKSVRARLRSKQKTRFLRNLVIHADNLNLHNVPLACSLSKLMIFFFQSSNLSCSGVTKQSMIVLQQRKNRTSEVNKVVCEYEKMNTYSGDNFQREKESYSRREPGIRKCMDNFSVEDCRLLCNCFSPADPFEGSSYSHILSA